jgi:HEAT repeat protein
MMSLDLRALLIAMGEGNPTTTALLHLSDLSREQMRIFRQVWPQLPTHRRRLLVQLLVELAEASFEAHFNAIHRACLEDSDAQVRAHAIQGLWEDQDASLVGPLLRMIQTDPAVEVRAAAAQGLGRFVLLGELEELDGRIAHRVVEDLLRVIHTPAEAIEVRRRAVESVSFCPQPEIQAVLEAAYYDEDEAMRLSAVCGMGRSLDKTWESTLMEELRSPNPAMRYEAVVACGELGSRQTAPAIIPLIDDPDVVVQEAAIWSLGRIGGEAARTALMAAYDEMDAGLRDMIEDALSELAFAAGDLDFPLYELSPSALAPDVEDEWLPLRDPVDREPEELTSDDWDDEWAAHCAEHDGLDSLD